MPAGFNLFEFLFGKREPEFPYLEKYLEIERVRLPDGGSQTVGMVCGVSSICAALIQVLIGVITKNWGMASLVWVPAILTQLGAIVWLFAIRPKTSKEDTRVRIKAHQLTGQLWQYRNQRQLKARLGQGIGELLDSGARYCLEARQAFDEKLWGSGGPETALSTSRERTLNAVDLAMARLLITCTEAAVAGVDFLSPALHPAEKMVSEMREISKTAQALALKIGSESSVTSSEAGTSELRDALADLQRLSDAHEEVEQIRLGH
ncbi:MAG: hypothetical protein U0R49_12050 [Fimbriimonadales bacterium]